MLERAYGIFLGHLTPRNVCMFKIEYVLRTECMFETARKLRTECTLRTECILKTEGPLSTTYKFMLKRACMLSNTIFQFYYIRLQ